MFFKIEAVHDCLAIRLDKIDVVKLEYNKDDLSDAARHTIQMYQANQDAPVAEYDVTKLTLDQRHELFDKIVAALCIERWSDSDSDKLVYKVV
jgi:hypothetical protein